MEQSLHLSTSQVARLCNVAPRTVGKWFASGALRGTIAVRGRDRQYLLPDVMAFMARHALPMGPLQQGARLWALVNLDPATTEALRRLATAYGYEIETIPSDLQGGFVLAQRSPRLILLNADRIGPGVLEALQQHPRLQLALLVALTASSQVAIHRKLKMQGFHEVFQLPIDGQAFERFAGRVPQLS